MRSSVQVATASLGHALTHGEGGRGQEKVSYTWMCSAAIGPHTYDLHPLADPMGQASMSEQE